MRGYIKEEIVVKVIEIKGHEMKVIIEGKVIKEVYKKRR